MLYYTFYVNFVLLYLAFYMESASYIMSMETSLFKLS